MKQGTVINENITISATDQFIRVEPALPAILEVLKTGSSG
jgi:hypothetical protein